MSTVLHEAQDRWIENIRSTTLDKCYRWARARVWMPRLNQQPAGWYTAERFPWVEEILNTRAKFNWVMKSAQIGATAAGKVRALYEIDYHQNDVLYILPTDKVASLFSKTRLANMIKRSPYLKGRTKDSVEVKQIGTSTLYIRGSESEADLISIPVSRLIMDEVDRLNEQAIHMAMRRLDAHEDKLIWGMSTPTYPGVGIHALYQKSTQEHFFFPCPNCNREIELIWPDSFAVRGESVEDPDCFKSFVKCYLCHDLLPHEHKHIWLKKAYWKPTAHKADPETRGLYINQLYAPAVHPGEIAVDWHRGMGDEHARREFHNQRMGLPFVEDGTQVNDSHIDDCLRDFSLGAELPKIGDNSIITLGIDQGTFHHWTAVRWTIGDGMGDIGDRARGKVIGLGKIFRDDWEEVAHLMRAYQVKCCVIDHHPQPTPARRFARNFPGYVWVSFYVVGRTAREVILHEDDFGANSVKCDRTAWLSKTLGRVLSGTIEFPRDIPLEFRQHLKNLVRSYKKGPDGNYQAEYVTLNNADHYAHALNYAELALKIMDPSAHETDVITGIR